MTVKVTEVGGRAEAGFMGYFLRCRLDRLVALLFLCHQAGKGPESE